MKHTAKLLPVIAIVCLGFFLRIWKLGHVPEGITNDEMGYIYNAFSLATTGKNIFGNPFPFLTYVNIHGFPFMPVPTYLIAAFVKILGLSATSGRLIGALMGTIDIILIYWLVRRLLKKDSIALLSALFLAISSWHIFLSRTAYDTNVAAFFFLSGIILFFREIGAGVVPIGTGIAWWLALFSYRGMNPVFPALALLLGWYAKAKLRVGRKPLLRYGAVLLLLSSSLLVVAINNASNGYLSEAAIVDSSIGESVNSQIREAKGPLWLRRMYLNKATLTLSKISEQYLESFSPGFLFLRGEANQIYSMWSRGRLYIVDSIFILIGAYYLIRIFGYSGLFFVSLVAIGGIPGMIGGSPYASRNFFSSLFFPVLTASGVVAIGERLNRDYMKLLFVATLVTVYAYLLGGFLFDYFDRYAFARAEVWFKSLKDMSLLVESKKDEFERIIVEKSSFSDAIQYAFYARLPAAKIQESWKTRKRMSGDEQFALGPVTFSTGCHPTKQEVLSTYRQPLLYIVHEGCFREATPASIIRDYEGNPVWLLYEFSAFK